MQGNFGFEPPVFAAPELVVTSMDVLHRALGLAGYDWQSLYHFTIGSPIEDLRLRTVPPYAHRAGEI